MGKKYNVKFHMDNNYEIVLNNSLSKKDMETIETLYDSRSVLHFEEVAIDLSKCMFIKFDEEEE